MPSGVGEVLTAVSDPIGCGCLDNKSFSFWSVGKYSEMQTYTYTQNQFDFSFILYCSYQLPSGTANVSNTGGDEPVIGVCSIDPCPREVGF